jgi:flavin-dependent dehydrogenase
MADCDYDLLIAGAGPAACAAALAARRRNLRVALLHRAGRLPRTCAGWAGPRAVQLLRTCGVEPAEVGVPFQALRLWPGDFAAQVSVTDADLSGFIVNPQSLVAALRRRATDAGAELNSAAAPTRLHLGEHTVSAELEGHTLTAHVLLIADGVHGATAHLANLPAAPMDGVNGRAACAVLPVRTAETGVDVVLGDGRGLRLTTIVRHPHEIRATLLTRDTEIPATTQLATALQSAARAGLVPAGAARTVACPCLAGAALDFEGHVQKRTLLVGDAGGFVAAFSQDGLYPALRSGWLAAETAADALAAPVLQDALAAFSANWRAELAEYLRMPNTDLGLLLPMVFTNPQMSRRVARAFLLGQAF